MVGKKRGPYKKTREKRVEFDTTLHPEIWRALEAYMKTHPGQPLSMLTDAAFLLFFDVKEE